MIYEDHASRLAEYLFTFRRKSFSCSSLELRSFVSHVDAAFNTHTKTLPENYLPILPHASDMATTTEECALVSWRKTTRNAQHVPMAKTVSLNNFPGKTFLPPRELLRYSGAYLVLQLFSIISLSTHSPVTKVPNYLGGFSVEI
jgi:hypothetical protein